MTEGQFLCDGARTEDVENPLAFMLAESAITGLPRAPLRALSKDYALEMIAGQPGDIVLTHHGKVVGIYLGESLAIEDDQIGKGLSTPMILAAVAARPAPTKRIVSAAGERALRKAWRVANGAPNPWP